MKSSWQRQGRSLFFSCWCVACLFPTVSNGQQAVEFGSHSLSMRTISESIPRIFLAIEIGANIMLNCMKTRPNDCKCKYHSKHYKIIETTEKWNPKQKGNTIERKRNFWKLFSNKEFIFLSHRASIDPWCGTFRTHF